MASAAGTTTLDFGAWPGSNEAEATVTGQVGITAGSFAEAWMMAEPSGGHTAGDAAYAALFIAVTCTVPVDGVGFTIRARAEYTFTGTFEARWVWSS